MDLNELLGNVKQNEATTDPSDLNIVILGEAKVGKTTLHRDLTKIMYGSSKGGLLLKFEDGVRTISDIQVYPKEGIIEDEKDEDGDIVETAFEKLMELKQSLIANRDKVPFKRICIDVIDSMYEVFEEETLRQAIEHEKARAFSKQEIPKKITSLNGSFGGFGAGERACNKLIRSEFYQPLKSAGYKFTDISHVRLAKVKNKIEEAEYQIVTSTLPVKSFNVIRDDAEIVLFIVNKPDGTGTEILFRDDNFYKAGSRLKYLPDKIDLNAQLLYDTMKKALEKEVNIKNGTADLTDEMKEMLAKVKELTSTPDKKKKLVNKFKEAKLKACNKKNIVLMTDEEIAKTKKILEM